MGLFCKHKWKIIQKVEVYHESKLPAYHKLVLQCEKCGKIKIKKV